MPAPGRDQAKRGVLSEQAFLEEVARQPDGSTASHVASQRLRNVPPPLEIVWRSGSFAIRTPDPSGSGRMLSLCVVTDAGKVYAYLPWLETQLNNAVSLIETPTGPACFRLAVPVTGIARRWVA